MSDKPDNTAVDDKEVNVPVSQLSRSVLKLDSNTLKRLERRGLVTELNELMSIIAQMQGEMSKLSKLFNNVQDHYLATVAAAVTNQVVRYLRTLSDKLHDATTSAPGLLETMTTHRSNLHETLNTLRLYLKETYYFYAEMLRRQGLLPKGFPTRLRPQEKEKGVSLFSLVDHLLRTRQPTAISNWALAKTYFKTDWRAFLAKLTNRLDFMRQVLDYSTACEDVDVVGDGKVEVETTACVTASAAEDFVDIALAVLQGEVKVPKSLRVPKQFMGYTDSEDAAEILLDHIKLPSKATITDINNGLMKAGLPSVEQKAVHKCVNETWHTWYENAEDGLCKNTAKGRVSLAHIGKRVPTTELCDSKTDGCRLDFSAGTYRGTPFLACDLLASKRLFHEILKAYLAPVKEEATKLKTEQSTTLRNAIKDGERKLRKYNSSFKALSRGDYFDVHMEPRADGSAVNVFVTVRDVDTIPDVVNTAGFTDKFRRVLEDKQTAHLGSERDNRSIGVRIAAEYDGLSLLNVTKTTRTDGDDVMTSVTFAYRADPSMLGKRAFVDVVQDTVSLVGQHGEFRGDASVYEDAIEEFMARLTSVKGAEVVSSVGDYILVRFPDETVTAPILGLLGHKAIWVPKEMVTVDVQ